MKIPPIIRRQSLEKISTKSVVKKQDRAPLLGEGQRTREDKARVLQFNASPSHGPSDLGLFDASCKTNYKQLAPTDLKIESHNCKSSDDQSGHPKV